MNSENQSTPWGGTLLITRPQGVSTEFVLTYNTYMGPNRIREKGANLEPEKRKALRNNFYMLG